MWLPEEQQLFALANEHNSRLEYEDAVVVSDRLLVLLTQDPRKFAYVLACRKAVALRHLSLLDEAETAFREAYSIAQEAHEPAICAYILNDWAAMHSRREAEHVVRKALRWLQLATDTPDPERVLEADQAYLEATLAYYKMETEPYIAYSLLKHAKQVLRTYAHGENPRYSQAYFIVLLWNIRLPLRQSPLGLLQYAGRLGAVAIEALRQGKVGVVFKMLQR